MLFMYRNLHKNLTSDAENVHQLLKDESSVVLLCCEVLWINASNILLSNVSFPLVFVVIRTVSFFFKSAETDVG
jgi:hypothetical protein